ncbi:hypothetical protein B0H66DRAFT_479242 [Apodospora peruviana]|uniref:MARVEL domain-containing protein n=1 Tax=Apodospora peruviana TaxID=516989 RepID=A0AAE0I1V9_9PEZI|nr:hypothetical protein B0H66DRAFT_479242 [Apodospora peruviana]
MVGRTRDRGVGMHPFFLASNLLIWVSAVIVMGIVSYWISLANGQNVGEHLIYLEVISVLTVVFFLAAFFLGAYHGYILLFNLIFSYLWLAAVVLTTQDFTHSNYDLGHTVEAFSYIAFFFLFFNVLYSWYIGYRASPRTTAVV